MTTFLRCARHAALPLERRCRGQLDLVPGEDPLVSADQLRLALAAPTPAVVWTSPLRRCSEVAARLAARIGAELRTDPRLLEMDFGEWEGRSWEDIERQDRIAYRDWLAAWRKI
ncbi:MAG TPA: histidine phosphatase family protein, partial [Myxococcales bacterium]|nr:histidine phosphatase family protein [Myxococcales bacterium]